MGNILDRINVMLDDNAILPTRAHETDAGYDLYAPKRFVLFGNDRVKIDTGVHFEIPEGFSGEVKSKSGLMSRGILTDGLVDAGYTGSVGVVLFNQSEEWQEFKRGEKIAQIVFRNVQTPKLNLVKKFETETERGDGGFGSTGRF